MILLVCQTAFGVVVAQEPTGETASLASGAKALFQEFCFDCHNHEKAKADVNLELLSSRPEFADQFKTWEQIAAMLEQREMPPAKKPQPSDQQRQRLIDTIRGELARAVARQEGDPGRVVLRRLTSAEYGYTIQDLTGLDLEVERLLEGDVAGGEGFANIGDVQFMQESTLERYVEAAKVVAAHAVIGAGPLRFYRDPGQTGLELSAIHRIQQIYRRHGFRTGAGEGAEPFGLERYPKAFYVAWQFQHRHALGLGEHSLAALAEQEGIEVRFAQHIWRVLSQADSSFPTSEIISAWHQLPEPGGDPSQLEKKARAACAQLYAQLNRWQTTLAETSGDDEESPVLTENSFHVSPEHDFQVTVNWPREARRATIHFTVLPVDRGSNVKPLIRWQNARIRFRQFNRRVLEEQSFRSILPEQTVRELGFGLHPAGAEIGSGDFVTAGAVSVPIQFEIPEGAVSARLSVEAQLDRAHGDNCMVRCEISDGQVESETAASTGAISALLADPSGPAMVSWKEGVIAFARNLPQVSHREPAPSDRDPIPAPYDNTYNSAERNEFHYKIKYNRDDRFLVENILDDAARRELDEAWNDLLTSFEYHDAFLRFVAGKFQIQLNGRGIAQLEREWIEMLPAEPRPFVARLHAEYEAAQQARHTAEARHFKEVLRFAEQAWRRPIVEIDAKRLGKFYDSMRQDAGLTHDQALRALLARILVAPDFLYRIEGAGLRLSASEEFDNKPFAHHGSKQALPVLNETSLSRGKGGGSQDSALPEPVAPLSDWELASRLSYFLWSSMPDVELRRAAESGRLREPGELERQARRMLVDPKARRLATEFFGQWFGFYRFPDYRGVDTARFTEFTDSLKSAMYEEAISFFEHIVRADRPVPEILFADYAFLRPELADFYGIPLEIDAADEAGPIRGVRARHRGGLLRMGAILTVTSAPLRTSAVKRGDWILRRLLGTPVPTPPADAGSIPAEDVLADGLTVRERLEAHRSDASCVNCHSRMDPLGFALEHYDVIGRWREEYRDGQPIDSSGTLNDGTVISGPDGLDRYLERELSNFHRTLCVKLLGYALGRSELVSDQRLIETMVGRLNSEGKLSDLVTEIVNSRQFRFRRDPEDG